MDDTHKKSSSLILNTLDSIPIPDSNSKSITALLKEGGDVTGYKLSDGSFVSKEEGINLARSGGISGISIAHRNDTEYLKSILDDNENNNLSKLPTINK